MDTLADMAKPESLAQFVINRLLPTPYSKQLMEYYKKQTADAYVVSFPKTGRTWLRVLLSEYFCQMHGIEPYQTMGFENLNQLNRAIPKIFFTHDDDYTGRPEDLATDKRLYQKRRVLFLVRDPRDVVVSLYFHRTKRDKDLSEDIDLASFAFGDSGGLKTIIAFYNIWLAALASLDGALILRYEDLHENASGTMLKILEHLGVEKDVHCLAKAIDNATFNKMNRKEKESGFDRRLLRAGDIDDGESFKVRRGKVGGYTDYFTEDQIKTMDLLIQDRLTPLLGYTHLRD